MVSSFNNSHIFDKKDDLALLFGENYNGDIYKNYLYSQNPKLVCSSGAPFIKVSDRGKIVEKIIKTIPSYDATLLRVFFHKDRWYLSTRKHIDSFDKTWNPGKYTFGQLFEEFVKFDELDLHLDRVKSYSFLLLSSDIQNVLPNDTLELIHVYTYDSALNYFDPFPINRPKFSGLGTHTRMGGWLENLTIKKIINGEEKTKKIVKTVLSRPQRGFLFVGESGRIYQLDFKYFQLWESIIQNRPWKTVFYDLLKKKVTEKKMEISLEKFFAFYANQYFFATYLYLQHIAKYIIQCYEQGVVPTQPIVLKIWYHVLDRNQRINLTNAFVFRQIVFQKYSLLDELIESEFCPILIKKPLISEKEVEDVKTLEDLEQSIDLLVDQIEESELITPIVEVKLEPELIELERIPLDLAIDSV